VHTAAPPHSPHLDGCLKCGHTLDPRHATHDERRRWCTQYAVPPQSWHWRWRRPCSHTWDPPQTTQVEGRLEWTQSAHAPRGARRSIVVASSTEAVLALQTKKEDEF
jgi:hypothetical protein